MIRRQLTIIKNNSIARIANTPHKKGPDTSPVVEDRLKNGTVLMCPIQGGPMRVRLFFAVVALLVAADVTLRAQTINGSISGTVLDL